MDNLFSGIKSNLLDNHKMKAIIVEKRNLNQEVFLTKPSDRCIFRVRFLFTGYSLEKEMQMKLKRWGNSLVIRFPLARIAEGKLATKSQGEFLLHVRIRLRINPQEDQKQGKINEDPFLSCGII